MYNVLANQSEQIDQLATALSKAQASFPDIPKTKKVKVPTKNGGGYEYWYADLPSIIELTRKPLAENGLSFSQDVIMIDKELWCVTTLMHTSGQWRRGLTPMILKTDDMQGMGGALTFSRRYGLTAILGIAADDDTDGDGANRDEEKPKAQPQQAPVKKPVDDLIALQKWQITFGDWKGHSLADFQYKDLNEYVLGVRAAFSGKQPPKEAVETVRMIEKFLDRVSK